MRAPTSEALIVSYESKLHALRLLRDLAPLRARLQVTLFDNASRDGTVAAVGRAYPWVRVLQSEENLGYAGALRAALPKLGGERLWLLNADVRLPRPDVLLRLEGELERDPLAGAVGPALLDVDGRLSGGAGGADLSLGSAALHFSGLSQLSETWRRGALYLPQRAYAARRRPLAVDWIAGTAPLIRREALERAGGVPPGPFLYGEDLLLSRALRRAGYRVLYCPQARVVHVGQGSQPALDGRWVRGTLSLSPPRERRALALCFATGLGARLALAHLQRLRPPRSAPSLVQRRRLLAVSLRAALSELA
ncbi:MAG: glycosyltransferase family 2 protein [Planctomycetes bacterium]|nr:glycosyltransferase family 2 protein [Planctomycetota bacterium]